MINSNQLLVQALCECWPEHSEIFTSLSADLSIKSFGYGEHLVMNRKATFTKTVREWLSSGKTLIYSKKAREIAFKKNQVSFEGYFNIHGLLDELEASSLQATHAPWLVPGICHDVFDNYSIIRKEFKGNAIVPFFNENVIEAFNRLNSALKKYYAKPEILGLVLPYDLFFIQRLALMAVKENSKKSLVYLHGLPGIYSSIDNLRADYLAVWGESIKHEYVKRGVDPERIMVIGHPTFSGRISKGSERFSLDDVLVLTKSMPGGNPVSDRSICRSREGSIAYPLLIQSVLQRLGVKKARLRPHPGENRDWYAEILGNNFYEIDQLQLENSLNRATLVIGPATTVWLQAHIAGVHFQVFEPAFNASTDILGDQLVPPFDASDPRLNVSQSLEHLENAIAEKHPTDISIFDNWVSREFQPQRLVEVFHQK